VQNEHATAPVIDPGDQAIVVAMNIEDSSAADHIRVREITPHLGERTPARSSGNPVPVHQGDQRIRVFFGKLEYRLPADDSHN
jgi:hypothetical protein